MMRDRRVRYVRNKRNVGYRGPHGNFRRVLSHASAEYFMWVSADDVRSPTVVEECMRALLRNPRAVMAHGAIEVTFRDHPGVAVLGNAMDLSGATAADRVRRFTSGLEHNAMIYGLYRRAALASTRYGDHYGHDYLVCLQTCLLGPIEYIQSPLIRYQQRIDSLDAVMYPPERLTFTDLATYRGVRRYKCWLTLAAGCWYLARLEGPRGPEKAAATAAFAAAFVRRYASRLCREIAFIVFTPVAQLLRPFLPAGVRMAAALRRGGLLPS
jgi:hypothetical protein